VREWYVGAPVDDEEDAPDNERRRRGEVSVRSRRVTFHVGCGIEALPNYAYF
jgi:hypothetical protein